eukprot:TRINITY_DN1778_c0_g3_i2.p2 TRINITY_DN1778_c0_g3~~TRINITY_DN1778_c0_g3_i2.p2  ORF type:complete len:165 (-),score=54.47 TRINITY_DN1778_c0_g3_i2:75-569(-)
MLDFNDFAMVCMQASSCNEIENIETEYKRSIMSDDIMTKMSFEQFVGCDSIDVFQFKPFPDTLTSYNDTQLSRLLHTSWEDSTFKMNAVMQNMLSELKREDYEELLERREKVKTMLEGDSPQAMWYAFRLFMIELGEHLMLVYKINSLNSAFSSAGLHELGRLC